MKSKQRALIFFTLALIMMDIAMIGFAFYEAYQLRLQTDFQNISLDFRTYWGMMGIHVFSNVLTFFFYRLYHRHRTLSHIDEFYLVFGGSSVGTIVAIALISFVYKNSLDYPRLMMIYAWILTILCVTIGRIIHARIRWALQARGLGQSRLLIVGTGDVARMIVRKIRQSPGIGYEVIGFISPENDLDTLLDLPVIGHVDDLADITDHYQIDEVIIGMPEASRQQILAIVASCERGRVSVKVFPDVFQIMATEVSIDDLNGLPLLAVRDVALRGWRLSIKRGMDIIISFVSLVLGSPINVTFGPISKVRFTGSGFLYSRTNGIRWQDISRYQISLYAP